MDGKWIAMVIAALALVGSILPASGARKIDDYGTVESICNGVPVYSFGNMMYVYGQPPDIFPGTVMQEGNSNPISKIKLKKSWEIKYNGLGATHELMPRSPYNDTQPFLPIHLIDGDPSTVWTSWGSSVADDRDEWIRIDLPLEMEISSVSLIIARNFPNPNTFFYGKALPKEIEVKVSKDAWHWETVYQTKEIDVEDPKDLTISFEPRQAKQIWIIGRNLTKTHPLFGGLYFSIGGVEVRDTGGENVALISRGAGVTVSSTSYTIWGERFAQEALWGPLQYDLGNKWVRAGIDGCGALNWQFVEHEKGKLEVDPVTDKWVTDAVDNGVNFVLCLEWKGNWIYADPPRKDNWEEARFREVNIWYDDIPPKPHTNPEMYEAWKRFIEYMVVHFKDRVAVFELGNEWTYHLTMDTYLEYYVKPMYSIIKKHAPNTRIMLGNPAGFTPDYMLSFLGDEWVNQIEDGKFKAYPDTVSVREDVKAKDVTASVDVQKVGRPGIAVRWNNDSCFAAMYCSREGRVFFQERINGKWGEPIASQPAGELGENPRLTCSVKGSEATLTLTDGTKTVTSKCTIPNILGAGAVGLMRSNGDNATGPDLTQTFDNFQVMDSKSKTLVSDNFDGPDGQAVGWKAVVAGKNPVKKGSMKFDGVGWHPWEDPTPVYLKSVRKFRDKCKKLGFNGEYYASEIYPSASYPPGPPACRSEYQMALYALRSSVGHSGLEAAAGPCHPHYTATMHPNSVARWTWPSQLTTTVQASINYCSWRNLATAIDDFHAFEFPVKFKSEKELVSFTFRKGDDKKELMAAVWNPVDEQPNSTTSVKSEVTLPGIQAKKATVVDLMNGTEQDLNFSVEGGSTVIKDMLIKDYPVLIKVK